MRKIITVFFVGALLVGLSNLAPAKAETEAASVVATQADEVSKEVPAGADEKKDVSAKGDEKTDKTDEADAKALKTEKKEEPAATAPTDAKKDETAAARKDEPVKGDKEVEAAKETPAKAGSEGPEKILLESCGKMAPVNFPHKLHGEKNACKDCHEGDKPLFEKKITKTGMKMADMYTGKLCGACHDGKKVVGTATVFEAKRSCAKCHVKK